MTAIDVRALSEVATVVAERPAGLRPALLAHHLDLTGLRHDYPLVLVEDGDAPVRTLSDVVDALLDELAPRGARGERLRQHVLRLETAVRRLLARDGARWSLAAAWDAATGELLGGAADDDPLRDSLARARDSLTVDGRLVRCDDGAPAAVVRHLHDRVERVRAAAMRDEVVELVRRLEVVLAADERRSSAGRDPDRLRAGVGSLHEDQFDFAAWADVLAARPHDGPLPEARRSRIEWALHVLRGQRFVARGADGGPGAAPQDTYRFVFDDVAQALAAYRERLPEIARLVRATTVARLELDHSYDEAVHGALLDGVDLGALTAEDLAPFPRWLVLVEADELDTAMCGQLLEVLASPLPFTLAAVTRDVLGPPSRHDPLGPDQLTATDLVAAALGIGNAPVVRTTSAGLVGVVDEVEALLRGGGPALVQVVTGTAAAPAGLPAFLAAAAATEARAVPTIVFDPVDRSGAVARASLAGTPQLTEDWSVHTLVVEDEDLQRVVEDVAFTVADLLALDERWADHVRVVPRAAWTDAMVPVADALAATPSTRDTLVPYVSVVGHDDVLRRVVVDDLVVTATARSLSAWRRLQAAAGVHEDTVAAPSSATDAGAADAAREGTGAASAERRATAEVDGAAEAPVADLDGGADGEEPSPGAAPGEAWIETTRCTTCDECTTLNPRMFAYNDDKQAYIADVSAGTYADLVQAAEACQVAIIHPGEPLDPGEPGLDELRRRAAAYA